MLNLITGDSGNQLYAEDSILVKYNPHPAFFYYSHNDIDKSELAHFKYDEDSIYIERLFDSMENIISRKNGSFKMNIYFDKDGFLKEKWARHMDIILEGTCSIDKSERLF